MERNMPGIAFCNIMLISSLVTDAGNAIGLSQKYTASCNRNFDIKIRMLLYAIVVVFVLYILCFYNHKHVNYTDKKTRDSDI